MIVRYVAVKTARDTRSRFAARATGIEYIAFVLAIVTNAVDEDVLSNLLGRDHRASVTDAGPVRAHMHTALWVPAAKSLAGAVVSLLRPAHQPASAVAEGAHERAHRPLVPPRRARAAGRDHAAHGRYHEEVGLLAELGERGTGAHGPTRRATSTSIDCSRCCASRNCSGSASRSSSASSGRRRLAPRCAMSDTRRRTPPPGGGSSTRRSATSPAS
jgi:hypothetical protein